MKLGLPFSSEPPGTVYAAAKTIVNTPAATVEQN